MEWILTNWPLILAGLIVTAMCIWVIVDFNRKPKEQQIKQVREWLLFAVTMAEAELGNSTGQLKLRYVYDLFVQRFPALANVICFEWFAEMVDDALEQMRGMLSTNKAIKAIVEGESA